MATRPKPVEDYRETFRKKSAFLPRFVFFLGKKQNGVNISTVRKLRRRSIVTRIVRKRTRKLISPSSGRLQLQQLPAVKASQVLVTEAHNNHKKSKPPSSLYGRGFVSRAFQKRILTPPSSGDSFAAAYRRFLERIDKKNQSSASKKCDKRIRLMQIVYTSSSRCTSTTEQKDEDSDDGHSTSSSCMKLERNVKRSDSPSRSPQSRPGLQSQRSVRFDKIEIREYSRQLGDNPSVSTGPPLTLSWTPHSSSEHSVEEYEEARFCQRREAVDLVLPPAQRLMLISSSSSGEPRCTKEEVEQVMKEVINIKLRRHESRMEFKRLQRQGEKKEGGGGWGAGVWRRKWRPWLGESSNGGTATRSSRTNHGSSSSRGNSLHGGSKRRGHGNGKMLAEARARRAVTTAGQA